MLDEPQKPAPPSPTRLDTFFDLPTLLTIAVLVLILLGQLYEVGIDVGAEFVRLHSNRGNVTVLWLDGCCELLW